MDSQACSDLVRTAGAQVFWPLMFMWGMVMGVVLILFWPRKPVFDLLLTQNEAGTLIRTEFIKDGWARIEQVHARREAE